MKKSTGIMGALITVLLFTGCAGDALPNEDTEKTRQSLEPKAQEEMTENCVEESDDEKYNVPGQQELTEGQEAAALILSEEELARIRLMAEEYYTSMNRKMLELTQADLASSHLKQEYEGYGPDEVVLFEVSVENSENKRYIAIGSKDGWCNCSVLNEGY